jgi:hypothetical protein
MVLNPRHVLKSQTMPRIKYPFIRGILSRLSLRMHEIFTDLCQTWIDYDGLNSYARILSKVPKCAKFTILSYPIFNLIIIESQAWDISRSIQITDNHNTLADPMVLDLWGVLKSLYPRKSRTIELNICRRYRTPLSTAWLWGQVYAADTGPLYPRHGHEFEYMPRIQNPSICGMIVRSSVCHG